VQTAANKPVGECESTASIAPTLGERFVHFGYVWSNQGRPQEGAMLIGYQPEAKLATVHWIDSWHNGPKVMACEGKIGDDGAVDVRGSYQAPPGPDCGWRIVIRPGGQRIEVAMENVSPEGKVDGGVWMNYEKVGKKRDQDQD
jgi:hypothetical protein